MKRPVAIVECQIKKRLKELKAKGADNLSKAEMKELLDLILEKLGIV